METHLLLGNEAVARGGLRGRRTGRGVRPRGDHEGRRAGLAQGIATGVKTSVGVTAEIEPHAPYALPRDTTGKGRTARRRVDDRRSAGRNMQTTLTLDRRTSESWQQGTPAIVCSRVNAHHPRRFRPRFEDVLREHRFI
jgi:hypothetical protein